ncbi:MAG: STAS domain-containing protein [Terracidiphilus sp.]
MPTAPGAAFHYQIEETGDERDYPTTTIKCQGKLISENTDEIRRLVHPLIQKGGRRIVLGFTDLEHVDSAGLGAIVGLKASQINKGFCVLDLVNLTPRVKKLLTMTNLLQLFSS